MAWTSEANGTQSASVGTTHTLHTDTDNKTFILKVDANNMTNGDSSNAADELDLIIETKVLTGGTSRIVYQRHFFGTQSEPILISCPVPSNYSIAFKLKQTAGVGRDFPWEVLGQ